MKLEFSSLEELTEFAKAAKLGKTEEIADICGRLSDLEARYDALHPKVVELERRLAGIKQEVTAEEASEALNDDMLRHARAAILSRYGAAALERVRALENLRFGGRQPGDVQFMPEWREEYLNELMAIDSELSEVDQPAAETQQPAAKTQQPEPYSDMRWHWCENAKCSEPIQIDHKVYLNTQACPKCGTSTLHEAGTNTKKGAADERLAFLQKQRAAAAPAPAPAPEQAQYIICEVAPKKEPVAAPAPAPAVLSLPVADTVAAITVKDCIAYAAELRRNNADILPALKKLLDDFGIPTLNRLPEEQAGIFMQKLKELQ